MKRGDLIVLGVCAALALGGGAWWALSPAGPLGGTGAAGAGLVVVTQTKDGQRRVDPLDADASFTVETPGGGENLVRIEGGSVEVISANCSNQVCVEHAPIASVGEQIVCLPHGVVVEVARDERDVAELG